MFVFITLAAALAFANGQGYGGSRDVPKLPILDSYSGQKSPPLDTPTDNAYGSDKGSNPYGGGQDTPIETNPYGGDRVPPALDTPNSNPYGGQKVPMDVPELPQRRDSNPYGGQKGQMDIPLRRDNNPYGGDKGRIPPSDVEIPPVSGACRTTDRWQGIIDCYDCELNKCAKECITELPRNFAMCYNKTALFNLRELFEDCIANDVSKCHRLTDDMALAFLLAHYDQAVLDLNRRNECIFRCGRPRIMNCMNMCDPLGPGMDVQVEPIVKCYKDNEAKIHDMLVTFAACLK